MKFANLVTMADRMQMYKYIIHQVAASFGKTATFMVLIMSNGSFDGLHERLLVALRGRHAA